MTILVALCSSVALAPKCNAGLRNKKVEDLSLIVVAAKRAGNVTFFNDIFRESDIIFIFGAKLNVPKSVTRPRRMFGRGSLPALEPECRKLRGLKVDYIQYNPEHWKDSHTPREEIADLVAPVRKARALARRYNARLSFTTDYVLLKKYAARIAPMVDMFAIQLQRFQSGPLDKFRAEASKLARIVRKANKNVPIYLQITFAPPKWIVRVMRDGTKKKVHARDRDGKKLHLTLSKDEILRQVDAVKDLADGIAFLYDDETRADLWSLVARLRK